MLKYFEKIGEKGSKYALQYTYEDLKPQDLINYIESQDFEMLGNGTMVLREGYSEEGYEEGSQQKFQLVRPQ